MSLISAQNLIVPQWITPHWISDWLLIKSLFHWPSFGALSSPTALTSGDDSVFEGGFHLVHLVLCSNSQTIPHPNSWAPSLQPVYSTSNRMMHGPRQAHVISIAWPCSNTLVLMNKISAFHSATSPSANSRNKSLTFTEDVKRWIAHGDHGIYSKRALYLDLCSGITAKCVPVNVKNPLTP